MKNDTQKTAFGSTRLSGHALEAALKMAGISKYRLAKDLEISYRIVQYWAKGRCPSIAMAERVAAYLGIQSTSSDDHADILKRLDILEKHSNTSMTADNQIIKNLQDRIEKLEKQSKGESHNDKNT